jgi:hypothetical protein
MREGRREMDFEARRRRARTFGAEKERRVSSL